MARKAKRAEKQGVSASAQGADGKPVYFISLLSLLFTVCLQVPGLNS